MRKIIVSGFILIIVFLIYLVNMDRKVYYLTLGDYNGKFDYSYYVSDYLKERKVLEKYVYQFSHNNRRITDITNDIKNNKRFKDITLKNALVKADLITINIDNSDIYSKLNNESPDYNSIYNYIDDLANDLDKLFKLVRQYCKEDIMFLGYYNPYMSNNDSDINDVIDYVNRRYKEICNLYNIRFIDISDLDMFDSKAISDRINRAVNKNVFEG